MWISNLSEFFGVLFFFLYILRVLLYTSCVLGLCSFVLLMDLYYLSKNYWFYLTFILVCFPLFIGIQWHIADHLPSHVHQLLKVRWHSGTAFVSFSCNFDEKNRVCVLIYLVWSKKKNNFNSCSPVGLGWAQDKSSICSSEKHLAELDLKSFWILMRIIINFLGQWQLSCFEIKWSRKRLQSIRTYDKPFHMKSSTLIL